MAGTKDHADGAQDSRNHSRRGLLAGAAGALGALAVETIAPAQPAAATQGQPVILGTDNTGAAARTGVFTTGNNEWGILADPNISGLGSLGVYGAGHDTGVRGEAANGPGVAGLAGITGGSGGGSNTGVFGRGGAGGGTGVTGAGGGNGHGVDGFGGGTGDGVVGTASTGNGMHGRATAAGGVGVLAENTAGGVALKATGPAVFSRSGLLTVAAGQPSATQTGVALTGASMVLATVHQNLPGVYVGSAVPNVAGSSFTINLSKAPSASASVAWFIVN